MMMTMIAPPPVQGGSRVYCPMVDVPAIERGAKPRKGRPGLGGLMCDWSRKRGPRTLRRYRRHWQREHWRPFTAELAAGFPDEIGRAWANQAYPHVKRDLQEAWNR
jgi:hypothetical protein